MRFIFVVLGLLLLLSGCAIAPIPLTPQTQALIKDKQIKLIAYKQEAMDIGTLTPTGAAFGLIGGGVISNNNGKQAIAKFGLIDPAIEMSQRLAESLANHYSARFATERITLDTEEPEVLARKQGADTLVLNVTPSLATIVYYPTNWGKYRVIYGVGIELLEGKSGQILAQGNCSHVPDDIPNAPSYDELFGGQGEMLKAHLKAGQIICENKIRTELLHLPGQNDTTPTSLAITTPTTPTVNREARVC